MKRGELRKLSDSARRKVSRNFGFRQSGYINWIVKDGYFFCLQHLGFASVYLEAKPMYAEICGGIYSICLKTRNALQVCEE